MSYGYLQPVIHQRELHKVFEQLTNSDVVKQQRRILQTPPQQKPAPDFIPADPDFIPAPDAYQYLKMPDGTYRKFPSSASDEEMRAAVKREFPDAYKTHVHVPKGMVLDGGSDAWEHAASDKAAMAAWQQGVPSQVNSGGIRTINWGENYAVASIETADGETLSPTPAPAGWQYLLGALFPFLGFLIPWAVIRAIGWVTTGFVQPSS